MRVAANLCWAALITSGAMRLEPFDAVLRQFQIRMPMCKPLCQPDETVTADCFATIQLRWSSLSDSKYKYTSSSTNISQSYLREHVEVIVALQQCQCKPRHGFHRESTHHPRRHEFVIVRISNRAIGREWTSRRSIRECRSYGVEARTWRRAHRR